MSYLFAGVAGGLLMTSVFVVITPIALVILSEDPGPRFRALLDRVSPMMLTMGVAVLSYPVWVIVGVLLGLTYALAEEGEFAGGIGSPNFVFTALVVVLGASMAVPLMALLRRVAWAVGLLFLVFVALFGWAVPHLSG